MNVTTVLQDLGCDLLEEFQKLRGRITNLFGIANIVEDVIDVMIEDAAAGEIGCHAPSFRDQGKDQTRRTRGRLLSLSEGGIR